MLFEYKCLDKILFSYKILKLTAILFMYTLILWKYVLMSLGVKSPDKCGLIWMDG